MSILAAERLSRQQVEPAGGSITIRMSDEVTVSSATFSVTREGVSLASGTATVTAITDGYILTATVGELPVNDAYKVTFTPNAGVKRHVLFDVVKQPYGPLIRIEDIKAEKPDLVIAIEQMAAFSSLTTDQFVEVIADRARCMLDDMLRDRLLSLDGLGQLDSRRVVGNPSSHVFLRGYMITDISLKRIERYLAVAEVYSSKQTGEAEEDEDARLYFFYISRAKKALESTGRIRIDIDQDGKSDGTVSASNTITMVREI